MDRHRAVAGSPARTVGDTWAAITELAAATLDRSPNISGDDVRSTLGAVEAAGRALVAAGQLNTEPLTLVATPLRLTIGTVSGEAAFRALDDENQNPVPGAATAHDWMLHLPRPEGLASLIDEVVQGIARVSTSQPKAQAAQEQSAAEPSPAVNLRRLDPNFRS